MISLFCYSNYDPFIMIPKLRSLYYDPQIMISLFCYSNYDPFIMIPKLRSLYYDP